MVGVQLYISYLLSHFGETSAPQQKLHHFAPPTKANCSANTPWPRVVTLEWTSWTSSPTRYCTIHLAVRRLLGQHEKHGNVSNWTCVNCFLNHLDTNSNQRQDQVPYEGWPVKVWCDCPLSGGQIGGGDKTIEAKVQVCNCGEPSDNRVALRVYGTSRRGDADVECFVYEGKLGGLIALEFQSMAAVQVHIALRISQPPGHDEECQSPDPMWVATVALWCLTLSLLSLL